MRRLMIYRGLHQPARIRRRLLYCITALTPCPPPFRRINSLSDPICPSALTSCNPVPGLVLLSVNVERLTKFPVNDADVGRKMLPVDTSPASSAPIIRRTPQHEDNSIDSKSIIIINSSSNSNVSNLKKIQQQQ
ncbi:unnamed protein product [Protopolystoma xenopodis]|uniref:Uncharacterized protein n=1 Tax=Protopolystoma xenopodis TaxID=117903 RepID=A0A3S5B419_9PLAT|nr:unnamed protein product [Protopolystoma xenopodis]